MSIAKAKEALQEALTTASSRQAAVIGEGLAQLEAIEKAAKVLACVGVGPLTPTEVAARALMESIASEAK